MSERESPLERRLLDAGSQSWHDADSLVLITDIKDCFHNMLTPEWLSDLFSKRGRYPGQYFVSEWVQSCT